MTALIVGILLVVGGVAFAAAPFLKRSASDHRPPSPSEGRPGGAVTTAAPTGAAPVVAVGDRVAADESPFASEFEELELDRAMGKLAEPDYQALRTALERRAATARASAGARVAATPAADEQVAPTTRAVEPSATGAGAADLDALAERLVREEREHVVACLSCGPRPEPSARFCSQCGAAIGACPACGHVIGTPGARFCDNCGTALAAR